MGILVCATVDATMYHTQVIHAVGSKSQKLFKVYPQKKTRLL